MKIIDKIKEKYEKYKVRKICSNLRLSAKGQCLINYLEDIINGKDVYIEAYEQSLNPFIEQGYTRAEAAIYQLTILNTFMSLGAHPYENN